MPTTMLEITICIPQAYFHADVTQTNSVAACEDSHRQRHDHRVLLRRTRASHLEPYQFSCSYIHVYALVLEPYQFSCSYTDVYAWVLEPCQFICSYRRIFVCVFQHSGGHLRRDNFLESSTVLINSDRELTRWRISLMALIPSRALWVWVWVGKFPAR